MPKTVQMEAELFTGADEQKQSQSLATVAEPEAVTMFERLAKDPAVDVEKLQRLIEMRERVIAHEAKAAFDSAYARMQSEIPEISEKGQIIVKGTVRSTYAKLEDITAAVRPILKAHGFAIRHRTEWPADGGSIIRIVGILSHEQGHSEESAFEAPMDKSEYRTDIQSMGSTVSYGRRYTTLDLLNIVTRGQDNDGSTSGRPQPPDGYDPWFAVLTGIAADGWAALDKAWQQSKVDFRNYAVKHDKDKWHELQTQARAVKRG